MIRDGDFSSSEICPSAWLQMTVVLLNLVFNSYVLFLKNKVKNVVVLCKFGKSDNIAWSSCWKSRSIRLNEWQYSVHSVMLNLLSVDDRFRMKRGEGRGKQG